MSPQNRRRACGSLVARIIGAVLIAGLCVPAAWAQSTVSEEARFRVQGPTERLEMIVNSSRILEFTFDVPRLLVNNPDLIAAAPLTPNSVQISGKKQGYTQLNVWDSSGNVTTVDILVLGDIRELDTILKNEFPEASLRLRPLASSLYITGYVPKADMIGQIVRVSEDYFPQIVNNITVGGVQEILLHVKVVEVSRTKLRQAGVDWNVVTGGGFITNAATGIITTSATSLPALTGASNNNIRFGVASGSSQYNGFLDLLQQSNMAKLLAEPTLTTMSGRPASFNVGGEIPVPLLSSNGAPSILFREFGTQIDFVPIVLGNGLIRLEVRPAITEVDNSLSVSGVPGFRSRRADVGVEMQAGQTLAIAGLVFTKNEAEVRGVPVLCDMPWVGAAFRKTTQRVNEVELVIMVRPEFASAMNAEDVPPCGPGQLTTAPTDCEQYGRAYLEVPKCANGGACNQHQGGYSGGYQGPHQGGNVIYQESPQALPQPANIPAPLPNQEARRSGAYDSRPSTQPNFSNARPSVQSQPTPIGQGGSAPVAPQTVDWHTPQIRPQPDNRTTNSATKTAQIPSLIGPVGYDNLK